ncbi:MAG TPA: trehalose-6-phosphate synthase [Hyphomicrobiaceae bacterium]|nr:trehalose-6-phosphate synthase [Hyphomicrobiaceae bacterium]
MQWTLRSAGRHVRNPLAIYAGLALAGMALIILTVAPLASKVVQRWSQRDVELRSRLVFNSIRDQVATGLATSNGANLVGFFDRIAEDERLLGLGFCSDAGQLLHATKRWPGSVDCTSVARTKNDTLATVFDAGRRLLVSAFPMSAGPMRGHFIILHDLRFVDERAGKARLYAATALVGGMVGIGLLAAAIMLGALRGWSQVVRSALADMRHGIEPTTRRVDLLPITSEMRLLLRDFRAERREGDGLQVQWSPQTLHLLLEERLPDTEVIAVSNREPYIHNRKNGSVALQIPASGLVAALEPVMRACGGKWIAHGSGSADRETVDARDHIRVPPGDPAYTLRRVWLSEEEQDGYYYGFANEGLWPLCHIAFVRPTFRLEDWQQYVAINQRFADAVAQEANRDNPLVLIHDYHFALLPAMVREHLPNATILTFWHIPWPNSETFSICPWREEIMHGLLGSTILGFHTQFHCNNFLEATDRFVESRIDREQASVTVAGRETMIRPYPISIEWPPSALAGQPPVAECREAVRRRFGLPRAARIAVGIERFDYTKGILDRMRAIDDLLRRQPSWKGRLVFIQAAAPTRGKLAAYSALQNEAERLADEINARHGSASYKPIVLVIRHHEPDEVFELFRAADVCVVSSLHDGMNLVAKEFVASRDDEQGVLILSTFAGAARELSEALMVNPYDTYAMGEALEQALVMPAAEQRERLRLMRDLVRVRNVYRWAGQMLLDAARLRSQQRIVASMVAETGGLGRGGLGRGGLDQEGLGPGGWDRGRRQGL